MYVLVAVTKQRIHMTKRKLKTSHTSFLNIKGKNNNKQITNRNNQDKKYISSENQKDN